MLQSLNPLLLGPDWWLPIDDAAAVGVDADRMAGLHRHASNVQHCMVQNRAVYGLAREVLVDGECSGSFVVTQHMEPPDIPVHLDAPADRVRWEVSREIFGAELVRVAGRLQPGWRPEVDLQDVLLRTSTSGGAVVDVEPDGDPVLLLDYEDLEDYQPTPHSIAADLAALNDEHALGIEDLVEQARLEAEGDGPLAGSWEPALVDALVRQGYVVYCSENRLAAYRFSAVVHAYLQRKAQPRGQPARTLFGPEELRELVETEGIGNALAMIDADQLRDAALADAWATAHQALCVVERALHI